ncbi:hypothetical protein DL89DRAFT_101471 [Linderina pennispora]|uniref:Uncharacterized protein n=1 Tax=Linderina pennispora TaxID=61395 RepID=A0A1Y1WE33_9FUNG|nr:uncharacterized protein DL89DRAFT_101471 [Linderina pennispora]ORX71789.1 hypothetical protein DL89DRAFT_101471 [Linderina pennispora]
MANGLPKRDKRAQLLTPLFIAILSLTFSANADVYDFDSNAAPGFQSQNDLNWIQNVNASAGYGPQMTPASPQSQPTAAPQAPTPTPQASTPTPQASTPASPQKNSGLRRNNAYGNFGLG